MSSLRRHPRPGRPLVALRRLVARRPWVHWLVVAATATAFAASVLDRIDRVDAARDSWGRTVTVAVATARLRPGDELRAEERELPAAMVPEGAVSGPVAGVVRQHLGPGEIVTELDVAAPGGPQAMLPDRWLAVPVVEQPPSGAVVGDRVQVVSDGFVLSADALVVGLLDDVTLVAVPADEAAALPAAANAGGLTLLLRP
jgi:Flp pilus assembly protein CpaB